MLRDRSDMTVREEGKRLAIDIRYFLQPNARKASNGESKGESKQAGNFPINRTNERVAAKLLHSGRHLSDPF